jgi:multicomponent Na+:H+ antiporter subunit E
MSHFALNIFLAFAWMALTGRFTAADLFGAFIIAYLVLWFCQPLLGPSRYISKSRATVSFVFFFLWELFYANLRVAFDVLTLRHYMKPGVIAVPLDVTSDAEITLLANLITLTPGTLSLDLSTDRKVLYVHAMYIDDVEATRRHIKEGFERRILELFR